MVVGDQCHALATLTSGKITRCPLYRRLGGPQGWSGHVRKVSPPTGIRSPGRPFSGEALYRLRYRGPLRRAIEHSFEGQSGHRWPLSLFSWADWPWRWRNYDCSKRRGLRTQRHGVICQKTWMLSNTAVSNCRSRVDSICWMDRWGWPTRNVCLDGGLTAELINSWRQERRISCGDR